MIFFKKEKEVIELILKHVDVVERCMTTAIEADLIRYEIRDKLYTDAFLPWLRDDMSKVLTISPMPANPAVTFS